MHIQIKCSLKSLSEKSKHGNSFQSGSFSGMRTLRKKSLTAGGMSGDSHRVKVYALLPLDNWSVDCLWRAAFVKKKILKISSLSMSYFSHTKYVRERSWHLCVCV